MELVTAYIIYIPFIYIISFHITERQYGLVFLFVEHRYYLFTCCRVYLIMLKYTGPVEWILI